MQNIVKNTDCTNHIKELWKVFTKKGKELFFLHDSRRR